MTARDDTHRDTVKPNGAHDDDVQQIVTLLQQRSGSVTVDYLRELSVFPELQLRACLDELRSAGRIEVNTGVSSVRIELREENPDGELVADGSGCIEDFELDIPAAAIFDLLSNDRRRELIKLMAELTPTDDVKETYHEISDLASMLAAREAGVRPSEVSCEQRNRTYISLIQVHADALNHTGVATYYERVKKLGPSTEIFALAEIIEAVEATSHSDGHLIAKEWEKEPEEQGD